MSFGDYMKAFIKGATLGVIQIEDDPKSLVTIKDPITGVMNIGKDILNLTRDFDQGVWIGKKPLSGGIGFSSLALEHFGNNVLHYCFRIQGKTYELTQRQSNSSGKKQSSGTVKLVLVQQSQNKYFQWFYKGPLNRTKSEVQKLIDFLNAMKEKYCLVTKNCQHFAKAICLYARKIFQIGDVIKFLFDKKSVELIVKHYGFDLTLTSGAQLLNTIKKFFD